MTNTSDTPTVCYPAQPTLSNLQEYVKLKCRERGFDSASDLEIFLLLTEEVGELAKAMRNRRKLFQEHGNHPDNTGEELADVLSYVLDLAGRCGINLEAAFREKEAVNDRRSWTSSTTK